MKRLILGMIVACAATAAQAKDCDGLSGTSWRRCVDAEAKAVLEAIDKKVYLACARKHGEERGALDDRLVCRLGMLKKIEGRAGNYW